MSKEEKLAAEEGEQESDSEDEIPKDMNIFTLRDALTHTKKKLCGENFNVLY